MRCPASNTCIHWAAAVGQLYALDEDYPDILLWNYSIFLSSNVSDIVLEPCNCVLVLKLLIEQVDLTFCIDNEALMDMCTRNLKLANPTYSDLNHLVSMVMSRAGCVLLGRSTRICVNSRSILFRSRGSIVSSPALNPSEFVTHGRLRHDHQRAHIAAFRQSSHDVDKQMANIQGRNSSWSIPPAGFNVASTFVANHNVVRNLFDHVGGNTK
jgi:tubulin beta